MKINNLQGAVYDLTDETQKELCQKELDKLIEEISKLQMALGKVYPWVIAHGLATCGFCGTVIEYEKVKFSNPANKNFHHERCIWLIALLAIGDYEDK